MQHLMPIKVIEISLTFVGGIRDWEGMSQWIYQGMTKCIRCYGFNVCG